MPGTGQKVWCGGGGWRRVGAQGAGGGQVHSEEGRVGGQSGG